MKYKKEITFGEIHPTKKQNIDKWKQLPKNSRPESALQTPMQTRFYKARLEEEIHAMSSLRRKEILKIKIERSLM